MGPVSLGVKPTVDSYGEIISSGDAVAFYDFVGLPALRLAGLRQMPY